MSEAVDPKDAVEVGATAAIEVGKAAAPAVVAGTGLTVAAGSVATAALIATLLPGALGMAWQAWTTRYHRRALNLLEAIKAEWAADAGVTAEEVAGKLDAEAQQNPDFADAISRAVRALMDAPSERAAVALGVLVAEYGREEKSADAFFRGVVRLFSELDNAELDELTGVLEWLLATVKREGVIVCAVDSKQGPDKKWARIPWTISIQVDDPEQPHLPHQKSERATYEVHPANGERLLHVLKWAGLAYEQASGGFGGSPPLADVRRSVADRLARLLRVA
ncbi:hypothetical protein ACSRUE_15160 [Sorangium sp. KYC3313]|uniref:hypothetical protein n=1 Tax=Sorangium sp. KYC3313 TaxID=3449740 RepID=UPI003F8A28C5